MRARRRILFTPGRDGHQGRKARHGPAGAEGPPTDDQEAVMNGDGIRARDDSRRTRGKTVTVSSSGRQVRVRRSSGRKLRDLPELDLRTPSGRLLPF